MILIYHKNESLRARDVALKDLDAWHPPITDAHVRAADKVIVIDGTHFRIFKQRDEVINPDEIFPLESIHLFLKESE